MKKTLTTLFAIAVLCSCAFAVPADAEARPLGWAAAIVGGAIMTTAVITAARCAYGFPPPPPRIARVYSWPAPWPCAYCAPRPAYRRWAYPPAVLRVVPPPPRAIR